MIVVFLFFKQEFHKSITVLYKEYKKSIDPFKFKLAKNCCIHLTALIIQFVKTQGRLHVDNKLTHFIAPAGLRILKPNFKIFLRRPFLSTTNSKQSELEN